MRTTVGLALIGAALLAIVINVGAAQGQGVTFGIRPAGTSADGPTGRAYFTYTLKPGESVDDEAAVINRGGEPVALRLYPADGVTAISGGTAFANAGEERTGVSSWLSTDVSDLEVAAGGTTTVPFTLRVPADASPGDHVAGWVVEGPPKVGATRGVGAAVIERVGVAVVVRVPGPTQEQLALGAMCLNQESGSNYFQASVTNEGNVLTRGDGSLTLTTKDGSEVFDRPVELGTVLPGNDTFLRLDAPLDPGPGSYVAELSVRQPNGKNVQTTSEIKIGEEKVNGCLAVATEDRPPSESGGALSLPGDGIPWLTIILAALVALLAAFVAAREFVWRRRR